MNWISPAINESIRTIFLAKTRILGNSIVHAIRRKMQMRLREEVLWMEDKDKDDDNDVVLFFSPLLIDTKNGLLCFFP